MKLVLKNNDGESVTLIIRQDETFAQLRRRVEDEVGISIDMKDIALKGKRIDEEQKVLEYFVNCGDKTLIDEPEQVCAVPGCNSTKFKDPGKTFFSFPQEEIRCHQWALYCQRLNMMSGKHRLDLNAESTVCSDHFRPDQFVKNTTTLLKRTAVPCINPDLPVCDNTPPKRTSSTVSPKPRRKKSQHSEQINENTNSKGHHHHNRKEDYDDLVCRLCARPSADVIFIFDDVGIQMGIAEKISVCLPITVKTTDLLPKQICRECCEELNHSYTLATTCLNAENKLKELKHDNHFRSTETMSEPSKLTDSGENDDSSTVDVSDSEMRNPYGCPLCVDGKMNKTEVDNGLMENGPNDDDTELDSASLPLNDICNNIRTETEEMKDDTIEDPSTGKLSDSDVENIDDVMSFSSTLHIEDSEWEGGESRTDDDLYVFSCRLCSADFRNYAAILQHALMHSDDGFYQCSLCDSYFSTQDDLEAHFTVHNPSNQRLHSGEQYYRCHCCGIGFKTSVTWTNHVCSNSKTIVPTNKCKVCLKGFRSQSRLQFHMKFHKGAKQGYCEVCQKTFPDEVKLYKHTMYLHSTDKAHCCEECGKIFRSVSSLRYHQRSHQGEDIMKPFSCDQCGKCFIRKSMLRNHIAAAHKNMSQEGSCYTCKLCHEAFPDTDSAVAHMESQHKSECNGENAYSFEMLTITRLFMCEYCDRCFSESTHLNNHREQHKDDTPYQCKYCNESFPSFGEHSEHKNSHDDVAFEYANEFSVPTAYLCEYCDRSFVSHIKFSEHLTVHYGPAPYHCRYCPMKFATSNEAVQHRTTHSEVTANEEYNFYRPYECHYCNKSFAIEDALVKHIRMHTGEKPFICDQCGKGFSQSSGLYTHQKVHSNERPYTCPLCPRTFKIKGDRDVHVRKHSGDRPYKCEFCGKAFMTQHVYSQHRKIHTGERPYKCDVCGIAFRRSHVLTVHKRIHTGEKPNVCDICGKRYRQKGDMLKHRRIQHGFVKVKLQKIEY